MQLLVRHGAQVSLSGDFDTNYEPTAYFINRDAGMRHSVAVFDLSFLTILAHFHRLVRVACSSSLLA